MVFDCQTQSNIIEHLILCGSIIAEIKPIEQNRAQSNKIKLIQTKSSTIEQNQTHSNKTNTIELNPVGFSSDCIS